MVNYWLGMRKQGGGQPSGHLGQCSASLERQEKFKLVHIIVIRCSDARSQFHYAFYLSLGSFIISG